MTVKELAGVFDGSTILYIQNEYEKMLDKKCAFFVEKSDYADKEVVLVKISQVGFLCVWIKE